MERAHRSKAIDSVYGLSSTMVASKNLQTTKIRPLTSRRHAPNDLIGKRNSSIAKFKPGAPIHDMRPCEGLSCECAAYRGDQSPVDLALASAAQAKTDADLRIARSCAKRPTSIADGGARRAPTVLTLGNFRQLYSHHERQPTVPCSTV
jgi:hypothetical protein